MKFKMFSSVTDIFSNMYPFRNLEHLRINKNISFMVLFFIRLLLFLSNYRFQTDSAYPLE